MNGWLRVDFTLFKYGFSRCHFARHKAQIQLEGGRVWLDCRSSRAGTASISLRVSRLNE